MTGDWNTLTCYRCKRLIAVNELHASVEMPPNGRGIKSNAVSYHMKCIPPNLFHQIGNRAAGSRPAGRVATD